MKNLRASTLVRVMGYGGLTTLAAATWAWAVGFEWWHGAVPGAVLGLVFSIFWDKETQEGYGQGGFSPLSTFFAGAVVIAILLALSVIGAIVGIFLRVL